MPVAASPRRIALVGFLSLAIAMGVGRFAFTPLLAMMREDGLVTVSEGGVIAAVHFLGYWLGALFAAAVPVAPRTMLRLSLGVIGLATLSMGLFDDLVAWAILRWVCGVASAWVLVIVGSHFIRALTAAEAASYHGLVFSGVGGGIALVGLACLLFMVEGIASPESWGWIGGISLVGAIAISVRFGSELPVSRIPSIRGPGQRSPLNWLLIIAYGTAGLGYIVPATFLPVMARDLIGDPLVYGWSWPVFGIAACLSTVLAAAVQRRFTNRQVWAVSQLAMALGVVLPMAAPGMAAVILSGVFVGGTFMIITMVGMKEAHRTAPEADVMRHIAMMTAAFATGQMIGPLLGSALYDAYGGFGPTLALTGGALAITAFLLFLSGAREEVPQP